MACNLIKDGMFGGMASVLVYVVAPLIGGLGASCLFNYFRSDAQY
jgi:hypothetical protein